MTALEIANIRAAIFDVIDSGCVHSTGNTHGWQLDGSNEDYVNSQRLDFADAVVARLKVLEGQS